jgi:hypothetical protein
MCKHYLIAVSLFVTVIGALSAGCRKATAPPSSQPTSSTSALPTGTTPSEQPVEPEKNPPGDIPDSQVFISFTSQAGRYAVKAPEGWARTERGGDVKFSDKFDGEQVILSKSATPPTVGSVQRDQIPALEKSGHAVRIQSIKTKTMPHGQTAVVVVYTSNSEPDSVTDKQIRLDNVTYYFYRHGTLAALTLWAPSGADNVDQWKLISESFRWL